MMLDLPQPLGPTTPTSWPGSMKLVGSANDLKPESLMELRRTVDGCLFYKTKEFKMSSRYPNRPGHRGQINMEY